MNKALNEMIDGYIVEAEECLLSEDNDKCENFFWRMKAGMEKQPNWTYSTGFAFYSKKNDGSYLRQMPKIIEALKSYKITRQYELDQLLITGQKGPHSVINVDQHNAQQQSQSQQQTIYVTFDHVINWVQNNDSLGATETAEILAEIRKIQTIAESPEPKKSKWEKMKPFLVWLGDKGVDLAIQVIPLILAALS